ncbi:DUF943 family protein [Kosakonia sp. H02]|nr:DUF943 family protein [Kosakonia sp. H02]
MLKSKSLILILFALAVAFIYINFFRQAEIMATDQQLNFANVAVKNFPLTESGKKEWWKENKQILQKHFKIPTPAKNGDWYISIWNYGEGFKAKPTGDIRIFNSDTQDMVCFNNDREKCI